MTHKHDNTHTERRIPRNRYQQNTVKCVHTLCCAVLYDFGRVVRQPTNTHTDATHRQTSKQACTIQFCCLTFVYLPNLNYSLTRTHTHAHTVYTVALLPTARNREFIFPFGLLREWERETERMAEICQTKHTNNDRFKMKLTHDLKLFHRKKMEIKIKFLLFRLPDSPL